MIMKMCARCGAPVVYPARYCEGCAAIAEEEQQAQQARRNRRYDVRRDKKMIAFYRSPEWRAVRLRRLQMAGYVCEYCRKAIAEEVHHETPIDTPEGWAKRYDIDGVRATCTPCHNKKHGRFGGKCRAGGGKKSMK